MKYINADKLIAEIERRKNNAETMRERWAYLGLLDFLDTLPEQPASEGLEEELDEMWLEFCEDVDYLVYASIARHFAEWGAEHLKK